MPLCFAKRPGLVVYVTAGDPDLRTTHNVVLAAIDAGADVVELGVPFSDPVADGPIIQAASQRALQRGTSLADVLTLARKVRSARPSAGLLAFSYLNPVLRMGLKEFCQRAKEAGLDGALLTDLTLDEAGPYIELARAAQLDTVFLAAPTSTEARLSRIAKACTGFVYAVSRTGVTGARDQVSGDAERLVQHLRHYTSLPIAVGFGIGRTEQVRAVGQFADAAVVGSALVATIHQAGQAGAAKATGDFVRELLEP